MQSYFIAIILLDQSCQPVTINYQAEGFIVTWNETLAGATVEAQCAGAGLNGLI